MRSLPTSSRSSVEQQKGERLSGHHVSSSAGGAADVNGLLGWELAFQSVGERRSEAFVLWWVRRLPCVVTVCENAAGIVSSASKRDTQMARAQYSVEFLRGAAFSNRGIWNEGSELCHLSEDVINMETWEN